MSMTNKLKRKKKSKSKSSSWGSAIKSFLQEFFLNDVNGCYMEYDENLTKEGKRKKTLISVSYTHLFRMADCLHCLRHHSIICRHH